MKNKQKRRRSLALIAVLILCIVPILTLGASALEPEVDRAAWAEVPAFGGGKDWFMKQYYDRYSEELPTSIYAVDLLKSKTSTVSASWAQMLRSAHDRYDQYQMFDLTMNGGYLGNGFFGFYGTTTDGKHPCSSPEGSVYLEYIYETKDSDDPGTYRWLTTKLTVRLTAQHPEYEPEIGNYKRTVIEVDYTFHYDGGVMPGVEMSSIRYLVYNPNNSVKYNYDPMTYKECCFYFALDFEESFSNRTESLLNFEACQRAFGYNDEDPAVFYLDAWADGFDSGYDVGYDLGNKVGHGFGYSEGYNEGYYGATFEGEQKLAEQKEYYEETAVPAARTEGFAAGQTDALNAKNTFGDMIIKVFNAPVELINGILDFEIFGINMASTVKAILTLAITAAIVFFIIKLKS